MYSPFQMQQSPMGRPPQQQMGFGYSPYGQQSPYGAQQSPYGRSPYGQSPMMQGPQRSPYGGGMPSYGGMPRLGGMQQSPFGGMPQGYGQNPYMPQSQMGGMPQMGGPQGQQQSQFDAMKRGQSNSLNRPQQPAWMQNYDTQSPWPVSPQQMQGQGLLSGMGGKVEQPTPSLEQMGGVSAAMNQIPQMNSQQQALFNQVQGQRGQDMNAMQALMQQQFGRR